VIILFQCAQSWVGLKGAEPIKILRAIVSHRKESEREHACVA